MVIVWTEDTFLENMETILMGVHNSDESDDTNDSNSELKSVIDSADDEEDDDA